MKVNRCKSVAKQFDFTPLESSILKELILSRKDDFMSIKIIDFQKINTLFIGTYI
jgi:hypothetical protein